MGAPVCDDSRDIVGIIISCLAVVFPVLLTLDNTMLSKAKISLRSVSYISILYWTFNFKEYQNTSVTTVLCLLFYLFFIYLMEEPPFGLFFFFFLLDVGAVD